MQIDLSQDLEAFIKHKVSTDITYNTESEWVQEAIREKINGEREYHEKLEALKADIDLGLKQIDAGQIVEIDFDKLMKATD